MTKTIRLAAEYECHPLWTSSDSGEENFAPSDLPISGQLSEDIEHWAEDYESTYDRDDPARSGFSTPEAEKGFTEEGLKLAHRLSRELAGEWVVKYFNPTTTSYEIIHSNTET
ncbi:hypothetical protein [Streptomyces qinglanensis]|uniref:hypothetical protein n=1 Tax=Streptomyces qinglanensis TaxID=943816 RepID=UPI000941E697|nr:hypothetical protein [Streptomyces qinglanensis]